jgi:aryl-alcohol dehydrogenase-like predicted oxidoreductase
MIDLRHEGKIRGFGVGLEDLDSALDWIATGELSSIQVPFGVLDPEARDIIIPTAETLELPVIARGVFAAGLVAKDSPDDRLFLREEQLDIRSRVRSMASACGVDVLQIASWFVALTPGVSTILVGASSRQHLEAGVRYVGADPPANLCPALSALSGSGRPSDARSWPEEGPLRS